MEKRGASERESCKKCSSLTPIFENREKGKIDYYAYYVFCAFGFKAAVWREDASALPNSGVLDPRAMPCRVVVGGSHSHS